MNKGFIKLISIVMLVVLIVASLTACNSGATTTQSSVTTEQTTTKATKTYKIAYNCALLTHNYFATLSKGMQAKAQELGNVELTQYDANLDATKQLDALENFIAAGYDGIIISPLDSKQLESAVAKAKEKGIWIMSQAQPIANADLSVIVKEYDYGFEGGKLAGQWIIDKLKGNAEVAILTTGNSRDLIERARGIQEGILKIAPNAKIVSVQPGNTLELGVKATETILQANPNVKVIASVNDAGALGACEAIAAAGKATDDFFVGGLDAAEEALAKMKEANSIFRATVDIKPYENGMQCIEEMVKMIENGKPSSNTLYINMRPLTQADLLK